MKKLNEQLQSLTDQAMLIIRERLKETNGTILFYDESAAFKDDELQDDFLQKVPELNHYFDFTGNCTCYPINITGDEFNATLKTIDGQGITEDINIFELSSESITLLADCLTDK